MNSGSEIDTQQGIQSILDRIVPGRYVCRERKGVGGSAIGKPVDLHILSTASQKAIVAIEVANVNTTQLVGETCRLYYDSCSLKLLVLGDRNVPNGGKDQCKKLLAKLYGQDDIRNTPARVVMYNDDSEIEVALRDLLLL